MIDFLSLFFDFIAIGILVLIILIGVKFFCSLVRAGQSTSSCNEDTARQLEQNSIEDSQADLYLTEVYPDDNSLMFPEEFDEDDDW